MIPAEILFRLVPDHDPEGDYPRDPRLFDFNPNSPARRIGVWAEFLRYRIHQDMAENHFLRDLVETSGFLATGVFHVPSVREAGVNPGFEVVNGYQFGAVLLRGVLSPSERRFPYYIPLESGRSRVPLLQTLTSFNPHIAGQDGYVAAVFVNNDGEDCGITAAHVVANYGRGHRVPVLCSDCGALARLKRKAPGLIDAAIVEFLCGGPGRTSNSNAPLVRSAVEGETVEAHFGDTGKKRCTIMMSLQTASEIKSAATPKHFLIDIHGYPGDSGSLISEEGGKLKERDLIGMYLGETDCENENHTYVTYGYALDLKQAADLLGASNLQGDFNV